MVAKKLINGLGAAIVGAVVLAPSAAQANFTNTANCQGWTLVTPQWNSAAYGITAATLQRLEDGVWVDAQVSEDDYLQLSAGILSFDGAWAGPLAGGTYRAQFDLRLYSTAKTILTAEEREFWPDYKKFDFRTMSAEFVCTAPPPPPPPPGPHGCTRTLGYWKTHYTTAPRKSQQDAWPISEGTLLCGKTYLEILQTPPRGDAWYILAHQYIAALLNVADGASSTAEVEAALATGDELLPLCSIGSADRERAVAASKVLDGYNNGVVGPGHCD